MFTFSCLRKRYCVGVEQFGDDFAWLKLSGFAQSWQIQAFGFGPLDSFTNWRGARVAMSVQDVQAVNKVLDIAEASSEADVCAQIDLSLPELFPGDLDLSIDFHRMNEKQVQVYAARQALVDERRRWAKVHKLSLSCLEPESLALFRVIQHYFSASDTVLLIHGRGGILNCLLVSEHQLVTQRTIDLNLLPDHAASEFISSELNQYSLKRVLLSGDLPTDFLQCLSDESVCQFDRFNPLKNKSVEQPWQFNVALGLALGEMYAAN